jgi:hypothetical protein
MYEYRLERWSGRLCNNIMQLTNVIYKAKKENGRFEQNLQHSIIKPFKLRFNDANPLPIKVYEVSIDNSEIILNERREILQRYILPNCRLPALPPIDCLVIHMRGGDILRKSPPPNSVYVQPPLSFYKKVIEDCPLKKIIILTEDIPNPCAKLIADSYDNCIIQSSKLVNDIITFLQATHVCFNIKGTFGITLALMSPNIKAAYIPKYKNDGENWHWHKAFKVNYYELSDTYIQPGEWNASDEQINQMITS